MASAEWECKRCGAKARFEGPGAFDSMLAIAKEHACTAATS